VALHVELLAVRHQLLVLERSHRERVRLTVADRLLWVWFSRVWPEWRAALVLVKPDTVVAWHRRGFRLFWAWKSRRRTGGPTVPARRPRAGPHDVSGESALGAPRIHGELRKLGIAVSQSTVATYMARRPYHRRRPGERFWRPTSGR
jgi:putative transposase